MMLLYNHNSIIKNTPFVKTVKPQQIALLNLNPHAHRVCALLCTLVLIMSPRTDKFEDV